MTYKVAMHPECPLTVRANIRLFLSVAPHMKEEPARAVNHEVAQALLGSIVTTK